MSTLRRLVCLAPALLGAGLACAGEPDPLFAQLADSALLRPRFGHELDAGMPALAGRVDFDLNRRADNTARPDRLVLVPWLLPGTAEAGRSASLGALAIGWQHDLSETQRIALTATQYRDTLLPASAAGTSAALSWDGLLGDDSRLTGQMFVGDEGSRDRGSLYAGRRYYGLLLEGRYAPQRDHTPFASLSWQRNDYESWDTGGLATHENVSRLAAGWNWQLRDSWGLRAEARYRLTDSNADPADSDRTQLYFSTRYGFR